MNASFKPIEKMSKKERKEYYAKQRNMWSVNPVTKKPENSKAYNRNAMKKNTRNEY